jgi:hypothetical protein
MIDSDCGHMGVGSAIRRLTGGAGAAAVLLWITLAAPAGAYTSPNYPGSKLSLGLSGASLVGHITTIVASGTNTTMVTPADYSLDVYAKQAKVDSTCADTSAGEKSTSINEPTESQIAFGLDEGFGPFSVPVKAMFNPGSTVICAYSLWSYDTATSAKFTFTTVSGAPAPSAAYKRAVAKCNKLKRKRSRTKCIAAAKRRYHVK